MKIILFIEDEQLLKEIKVDNKVRFRYQVGHGFPRIDASIGGASTKADTQISIFDSSALEKQL